MSWLGAALQAVTAIGGSLISSSANKKAANVAAQATNTRTDAIREGNRVSQQQFEDIKKTAKPGVDYLRSVVTSDPRLLMTGQQERLNDARRQTIGSLSASGLRGAGRTTTAAVRDVERRFGADAYESNRNRLDRSAGQLSQPYFSASTTQANQSAQTGRDVANSENGLGAIKAESATATGENAASTLGALSSIIADEQKAKGRDSKYSNGEKSTV